MSDCHLALADERHIAIETAIPEKVQSLDWARSRNRVVVVVEAYGDSVCALMQMVGQIDRHREITSEVVRTMHAIYPHIGNIHRTLNIEPPLLSTQLVNLDRVTIPADTLPLLARVVLLVARCMRKAHPLPIGAVERFARVVRRGIRRNAEQPIMIHLLLGTISGKGNKHKECSK